MTNASTFRTAYEMNTPMAILWNSMRSRFRSLIFEVSSAQDGAGKGNHKRSRHTLLRKCFVLVGICAFLAAALALFFQRMASRIIGHKDWAMAPINHIPRVCPSPQYPTLGQAQAKAKAENKPVPNPSICITTLTDEKQADWKQRTVRWRKFDNLLELTWANKEAYCAKHGYHLVDSSPYLDRKRPPSWSKIIAVQRLLRGEGFDGFGQPLTCDWVIWLDADTVVMNSTKKMEDVIPAPGLSQDLVITRQKITSYNAGAWMIQNTKWSRDFLDEWWGMESFVRAKGLSVSGDNDALYHMLRSDGDGTTIGSQPEVFKEHILVPPRCTFNSVTKWVKPSMAKEYARHPERVKDEEWYMHEEMYHLGDMIAHIAGRNNKIDTAKMLLEDAS